MSENEGPSKLTRRKEIGMSKTLKLSRFNLEVDVYKGSQRGALIFAALMGTLNETRVALFIGSGKTEREALDGLAAKVHALSTEIEGL
jgi:hypothetical protein